MDRYETTEPEEENGGGGKKRLIASKRNAYTSVAEQKSGDGGRST